MRLAIIGLVGCGLLAAQNQLAIMGETMKDQDFGLRNEVRQLTDEMFNPDKMPAEKTSFHFPWDNLSKIKFRFISKGAGIKKVTGFVLVVRLPNLRSDQITIARHSPQRP